VLKTAAVIIASSAVARDMAMILESGFAKVDRSLRSYNGEDCLRLKTRRPETPGKDGHERS